MSSSLQRCKVLPRARYFDVLVVGAGPAGSHLALRLARAGFHVGLLDRQRFPRPKPCGEFMSPECLPMLEELGLRAALLAHGARCLKGMRLHGHGYRAEGRYRSFGNAPAPFDHGYAIRREVLDELALEAACACSEVEHFEACSVSELLRDESGAVRGVLAIGPERERLELRAAWTIGADGVRSAVARELGVQRTVPGLDKLAVVARYDGVPAVDHAEVHFYPDAYIAAAPVDEQVFTLNLVIDRARVPGGGRGGLEEELARRIAASPELDAKLGGKRPCEPLLACGPLARTTTRQTFDGAALVGDACSFVDPMTGEGLYFAMRGAELLAAALVPALHARRTDRAALAPYLRGRKREIAPRQRVARWMQRGLRHPALVRGFLGLLQRRPSLADLVVALTGDYVSPRDLLRPSLWRDALRRPAAIDARRAAF
ncbi:MAG: FAD-dependent monooxygenase [Planctomycetes bacterium]|nr:FAD-dependent monooxygenase [Planctomycetota bacterium]